MPDECRDPEDPAGDPCLRCAQRTINVCGHCERPVCPTCLLAHWREDCDLTALGPTTQALTGLGRWLQDDPLPHDALDAMRQASLDRERAHPTRFILDAAGEPVPEPDLLAWAAWCARASRDGTRLVAQETRVIEGIEVLVSTVFLGLDHGFGQAGAPVLWETMLFWSGHVHDGDLERYRSREAAAAGHRQWVAWVFGEAESEAETLEAFTTRIDRLLAEVQARGEEADAHTATDQDDA